MGRGADGLMLKRKYRMSLFIVVLVVDLLLTCALFLQYSGNQISRTTEYSTAQLQQVCHSLDLLYESMEAKVKQIMVDPDTVTFLLSTSIDRLQEGKVGVRLRAMRSSDAYIRYITLYNTATGHFVSSSSAGFGEELLADTIFDVPEGDASFCFLRPIGSSYNTQAVKTAMVYTFVFPVQLTAQETDYIIIDVNDSYFSSTLEPIRLSGREQQLVFLDSHQQAISHMNAESDQEGFSISSELPQDLFPFAENRGDSGSFFYWDSSRGRRFATFARAPLTGWTIYNIMPSGAVLEGIASAMALTLALAAVTLTFGYILSRRVSSSLYAPIQSLFESFVSPESQKKRGNELELLSEAFSEMYAKANRLEQGLTASYRDSKQMYLRYLLFGEQNQIRSAATACQRLDIDLSAPGYGVVLMQCVPQLPDHEENLFICYYALENISRELLATPRGMEFLRVDENRFAALLYLDSHELEPRFLAGLERIAGIMSKEFHIDTTICLGDVANSWENINISYEQTRIALDSHSTSHYGKAFLSSQTPEAMNSELYYTKIHAPLANHVRAEDMEACAREFDGALVAMGNISFKTAKTYTRHVLMSVLDCFSSSFEGDDQAFALLMEQLNQLDDCRNVQSVKAVFLDFLDSISRRLAATRKSSNEEAALRAKEYIDRNYADPDLSVRMLAEWVNLSPSYLGKVFSAVTTYSFTDYVNNVRITKAAELLTSTDLPVAAVSQQVGITNTNYFYSLFKKRYGVTPSSYRRQGRSEQ